MWLDHKRHSKKEGQCIPYGKKYRSTVMNSVTNFIWTITPGILD